MYVRIYIKQTQLENVHAADLYWCVCIVVKRLYLKVNFSVRIKGLSVNQLSVKFALFRVHIFSKQLYRKS